MDLSDHFDVTPLYTHSENIGLIEAVIGKISSKTDS